LEYPFLSVVLPCRNEERYIRGCLSSLTSSDYPRDKIEIIVADGMSSDKTREIIGDIASEHSIVRVIDNTGLTMPSGANIGIEQSRGDIIFVLNAHSIYGGSYLSRCVKTAQGYEADAVGGVIRYDGGESTFWGPGIQLAFTHSFGIGNGNHRLAREHDAPFVADSPGFAGVRRQVWEQVGLYNEALKHSQDFDLFSRMRSAGFKLMLDPLAEVTYYPRVTLGGFVRYSWRNGIWISLPTRLTGTRFAVRHFVPGAVFLMGSLLLLLSLVSPLARRTLTLLAGTYGTLAVFFAYQAARKRGVRRLAYTGALTFFIQHAVMGAGTVWGLLMPIDPDLQRRAHLEPRRLRPRNRV